MSRQVVVERDETLYPSRGCWPRFRGKTGTVTGYNHGEVGVQIKGFGEVWFQKYELRTL